MFKKKPDQFPQTEAELARAYAHLSTLDPATEEYRNTLARVKEMHEIAARKGESRIDPNTALSVAGNLAGIIAIVKFERASILVSKAMQIVVKAWR